MRKYLSIALAVAMVLGLAVSSFAAETVAAGDTKITIGGEIRVRGEYRQNNENWTDNGTKHYAAYDQRVKLAIKAEVNKNTTGMLEFMTGANTNDIYNWNNTAGGGMGVFQAGNSQYAALGIYQAWLQHVNSSLLGFPVGIKVGHMPLKLGRGLFFDHTKQGDDAIVVFADPTKELHIGLVNIKFDEGTASNVNAVTNSSTDADAYALVTTYKLDKTNSLGLNFTFVKDRNFYGINVPNATGFAGGATTQAQADVYNLGFNADMNFFGVDFYADIEKQWGTCKNCDNGSTTAGTNSPRNLKFGGLAYMVGAGYKLDPVKLTLEYAYGSGDDFNQDQNGDGVRDNTKFKGFITALGTDKHYTYTYEYRTRSAANSGLGTGGKLEAAGLTSGSAGLNNTKYIKLAADIQATKDLTANLSFYNLKSVKGTNMTHGMATSAAFNFRAARINTAQAAGIANTKLSTEIGNEVDWNITYQIDKNLKYWVEGGYLWVGSAWDYYDTVSATNKGADNIWTARHGIQLNF
ncbi:MAG: hypothetical protein HQL10_02885 [Nitrospirae bacterium]|nr:hypothetical protein [Nitrospirota bacterium]